VTGRGVRRESRRTVKPPAAVKTSRRQRTAQDNQPAPRQKKISKNDRKGLT
jgi:hypothetical protein